MDFDGTLAPLEATPETVTLGDGTRRALARLARHRRVRAIIVSGRRREELVHRVRLPHVQYWGLFGWERRRGRVFPRSVLDVVSRTRDSLTSRIAGLRGIWIEDKSCALAVHFRSASPAAIRHAHASVHEVLVEHRARIHLTHGAKVWNLLPREVLGKGAAVRHALATARTTALSVYVGDDATDEPAFNVLKRAITVRVGSARHTHARYRLADPAEVRRFIERLDAELSHDVR